MQLFILIVMIGLTIYAVQKQKKEDYNKKVKEIAYTKILYSQQSNRNILRQVGDEGYIKYFGQEQYDKIKAGTDTKTMEMLQEWKDKL